MVVCYSSLRKYTQALTVRSVVLKVAAFMLSRCTALKAGTAAWTGVRHMLLKLVTPRAGQADQTQMK